jgi:hypothetical protein
MACRTRTRGAAIVVVFTAGLLATAAPVAGQTPPPSAVDQYVEMVPSAAGPKAPGREKKRKRPLPSAGQKALAAAPPEIAKPLEDIATSPDYGAPAATESPRAEAPRAAKPPQAEKPKPRAEAAPAQPSDSAAPTTQRLTDATFASTVSAVASTSADDERVLGLVAMMATTMLVAIGLAVRRARQLDA